MLKPLIIKLTPHRLRKLINPVVLLNHQDKELIIPAGLPAAIQNVYWKSSWKTEIIEKLTDEIKGIFVDVGANVGQTLLDHYFTKSDTPYIGFEPNLTCVIYLNELIKKNSLTDHKIFPVGLAEDFKFTYLQKLRNRPADSSASIIPDLRPGRIHETDIVPCVSFDKIHNYLKMGKIGFIKIDVEGAELETLQGMQESLKEYKPLILCEVLFTDSYADLENHKERNIKIMSLLKEMNYKVLRIIKSEDLYHVSRFEKMEEFPSRYWTEENKELCDYLFVPEEKEQVVLTSFNL